MKLMTKAVFFAVMAALCAASVFGQKKESLALLPFTGGTGSDGEYIVSELARQRVLRDAFTRVTLVTSTTRAFMQFEHRFQRDSGLTDADTIFELGKQLNAAYVIAGYITKLGTQSLVLVSILDVESLQQIAGDHRTYTTIEEVDALIPDIAKKLAASVQRDTSRLPGLSVPPFEVSRDVNVNDAQVLAQILASEIANGNTYAVLPRTDSLQKVLDEHHRGRTGETDQARVKRLGVGKNAQYVLAGSVAKLGNLNKFTADVLNIEDGSYIDGYSERYTAIADGSTVILKLAGSLNGTSVSIPAIANANQTSAPANMVLVPAGTFQMGGTMYDSEKPIHSVTISKPFYIGKYEVTQKEWVAVMGSNPSYFKGDNLPVEQVSWLEVIDYCNKRSVKEGLTPAYTVSGSTVTWNKGANGYRLPTEAEWEYACRAGTSTPFSTGSNITTNQANYDGNYPYNGNAKGTYRQKTWAVGSGSANSWGLYDMHGNVWEWCWDWYGDYSGGSQTDPTGASSGSFRVFRGGSWDYNALYVRSAFRFSPTRRPNNLGFRVLRP
jgi:formylglycine-generating enzyme required for sulfatase activity